MTSTSIDESVLPSKSSADTTLRGMLWAGASLAILSGWFVVTRLGLRHDLRIWDVIALRFGEGALLLTPTLLVGPLRLRLSAWPQGAILAFLWGAPFILLVVVGLQTTSATLAASITPTLMPVFAGLIAWCVLGEAPRSRQLYGYVLIVAGLLALIWDYVSAQGRIDMGGAAALVAAAVMWALYTLQLRRSAVTSLQAAALICFWSAMFYLPIYFGLALSHLAYASGQELMFQSFYQGLLMSAVAIFAFNRAVVALGPRAAAAIIALVPVTATVLAIPILGDWPSTSSAIAIGIIAVGVLLAAVTSTQKAAKGEKQ